MSVDSDDPSWFFLAWSGLWLAAAWLVVLPLLWFLELRDACRRDVNRWRCRWDFARLDPHEQRMFEFMGTDPESLIKRGEL